MKTLKIFLIASSFCITFGAVAQAACPTDIEFEGRLDAWIKAEPVKAIPIDISIDDAYCAQDEFNELLSQKFGNVIGYKVAFTSAPMQKAFGMTGPAYAPLYKKMILNSGDLVQLNSVYRPLFEADLVVSVKDDGINNATTIEEVVTHLDKIYPFIELPDLAVGKSEKFNGTSMIPLNLAARFGVIGQGQKIENSGEFLKAVRTMKVVLSKNEEDLQEFPASVIMGDPFAAALWLVENLNAHGKKLKSGDLISLGSIGKLYPVSPESEITATYIGLPNGTMTVSVNISK